MVRLHAVVGPRMRQEDVLQKHQLLRQQLDTLLQLFILLHTHNRYYKFKAEMKVEPSMFQLIKINIIQRSLVNQ